MKISIGYIIVFVRDMEKSVAFYRDGVGLAVKASSPHWTEFDVEGTTLALHGAEGLPPAPKPLADPSQKKGAPQEIVFQVADPIALRDSLCKRGVNVAKPKMVHEAGPDHVGASCLFEDPDGNLLSVYGIVAKNKIQD